MDACLYLYPYLSTRASDFRSLGSLLMGAIFPMASEKARQGYVRKREREAKRAAEALGQAGSAAVDNNQVRVPARASVSTDGRESSSPRSSLFAKIRAAALALGPSERTATRKARLLASASYSEFRRLTPEQNVKQGRSPKARHYVLKTTKRVTKATPTISARQFETKRARELYNLTPKQATEARRQARFATRPPTSASASPKPRSRGKRARSSLRSRSSAHRARRSRAIRRISVATDDPIPSLLRTPSAVTGT